MRMYIPVCLLYGCLSVHNLICVCYHVVVLVCVCAFEGACWCVTLLIHGIVHL